jgi:hypothetical protein
MAVPMTLSDGIQAADTTSSPVTKTILTATPTRENNGKSQCVLHRSRKNPIVSPPTGRR